MSAPGSTVDWNAIILDLLAKRAPSATICPSDAARLGDPAAWRARMGEVRAAAADLADAGDVEVTQHGVVVNIRTARGPVRIRRRR